MPGRFGLLLLDTRGLDVARMRAELRAALELLRRVPDEAPPDETETPTGHAPVVLDSRGRIVVAEGTAPLDFSDEVRRHFPREVWGDAARIAYYESDGWKHDAELDTRGRAGGRCGQRYYLDPPGIWATTEHSIGYFQINICAHGGDVGHWEDVGNNVRKAAELYRARGNKWTDWLYTANRLGLLED